MRFAMTGSQGLLGGAILQEMGRKGFDCWKLNWQDAMVSTPLQLASKMREQQITHLVHAAANTNLERGECDKVETFRDNTVLSEILAAACQHARVRIVFISSTGVYGSYKKEPYLETDPAMPTTVHHQSKYLAEVGITSITEGALILRVGWLFGGATHGKSDFVSARLNEARNSMDVMSNVEQFGCPTYTVDVARMLLDLVAGGFAGVFNCVNEGVASRFDYVREIYRIAGVSVNVQGFPASVFNRVAPVSNNEMATCHKLSLVGVQAPESWRSALRRYMTDYGMMSP